MIFIEMAITQITLYWLKGDVKIENDIVDTVNAFDGSPRFDVVSSRRAERYSFLVLEFDDMELSEILYNLQLHGQLFDIDISMSPNINGMYRISRF